LVLDDEGDCWHRPLVVHDEMGPDSSTCGLPRVIGATDVINLGEGVRNIGVAADFDQVFARAIEEDLVNGVEYDMHYNTSDASANPCQLGGLPSCALLPNNDSTTEHDANCDGGEVELEIDLAASNSTTIGAIKRIYLEFGYDTGSGRIVDDAIPFDVLVACCPCTPTCP
jgi:hypothetical protein